MDFWKQNKEQNTRDSPQKPVCCSKSWAQISNLNVWVTNHVRAFTVTWMIGLAVYWCTTEGCSGFGRGLAGLTTIANCKLHIRLCCKWLDKIYSYTFTVYTVLLLACYRTRKVKDAHGTHHNKYFLLPCSRQKRLQHLVQPLQASAVMSSHVAFRAAMRVTCGCAWLRTGSWMRGTHSCEVLV